MGGYRLQSQLVLEREPILSGTLSGATPISRWLPAALFWMFLATTVLAVFIPFNPSMPSSGIDPSYAFAINQAVARHLSFGRQIVFTYGPYASVITRMYDPATDRRMICGSALVAVAYTMGLLFLAGRERRSLVVILLLTFATFGPGELLLFSYPFLFGLCFLKQAGTDEVPNGAAMPWRQRLAAVVMLSTLGLLPVVKGSLLLPFAASVGAPLALLVYRKRFGQATLFLLTPIFATLVFWKIAGQSLADIAPFFRGVALLTSGYTEAMSTPWSVIPTLMGDGLVLLFLALSGLIFLSVARLPDVTREFKWALRFLCAVFLLVAFKHGFVSVLNVSTAFSSVAILIVLIGMHSLNKYLVWALCIAITMATATSIIHEPVLVKQVHDRFGVGVVWTGGKGRSEILSFCLERAPAGYARATYKRTWGTYSNAWDGLSSRLKGNDELRHQFDLANATIRSAYPIPLLQGTADIYQYDQAVLFASGNAWSPRPVLQGYSAYTPELARLDEKHLRGLDAPDWIFFGLQTIDGRLPSLDDGLSWPAFLDNYSFVSYNNQFLILRKNQVLVSQSRFDNLSVAEHGLGATVSLPETDGLLFAQINLKPTLIGRLLTDFLNSSDLYMVVGFENGKTKTFRIISNMMRTDILISPLISNTGEFASLMAGLKPQAEEQVRTISIMPADGGSSAWAGTYELTLKRYVGPRSGVLSTTQ